MLLRSDHVGNKRFPYYLNVIVQNNPIFWPELKFHRHIFLKIEISAMKKNEKATRHILFGRKKVSGKVRKRF